MIDWNHSRPLFAGAFGGGDKTLPSMKEIEEYASNKDWRKNSNPSIESAVNDILKRSRNEALTKYQYWGSVYI